MQERIYLGDLDTVGIREANRLRAEKLKEINGQVYTIQSHIPFGEFVVTYNNKHLPTVGAGTQAKYRMHLTNHILPEFAKYKLADVGTEEIQDFLNRKSAAGLSWWTCNDLRNIISGIFTQAEAWGYWKERNPAERVNLGKEKTKRELRLLTDEQVNTLLAELPADISLLIRLADSTAMRISEILGLKWGRVNLDTGWLEVKERYSRGDTDVPKSKKSKRALPLGELVQEFRDHKKWRDGGPDDYVFGYPDGRPYDDRTLNQHFLRKIAKKHGFYFKGLGFHSFRRGMLTGVQEDQGASSIEAQNIAGHSKPEMTSKYFVPGKLRQEDLVRRRQQRLAVVPKSA